VFGITSFGGIWIFEKPFLVCDQNGVSKRRGWKLTLLFDFPNATTGVSWKWHSEAPYVDFGNVLLEFRIVGLNL
jgi:hypothetical protein